MPAESFIKEWASKAREALHEVYGQLNGAYRAPDLGRCHDTLAIKLLALHELEQLSDPERIYDQLCRFANQDDRSNAQIHLDQPSDPGRIFLELFALLQTSLTYHVSSEIGGLLQSLLALAGHTPRRARPAVTIIGCNAAPGTTIDEKIVVQPPASWFAESEDKPEDFEFVPARAFDCWSVGPVPCRTESGRVVELKWPAQIAHKAGASLCAWVEVPQGLLHHGSDVATTLRYGAWSWRPAHGASSGHEAAISVQGIDTFGEAKTGCRVPLSWLVTERFAPAQWLFFNLDAAYTLDGNPSDEQKSDWAKAWEQANKISWSGSESDRGRIFNKWLATKDDGNKPLLAGFLICRLESPTVFDDAKVLPRLWGNHIPWVNHRSNLPAQSIPDDVTPDFLGLPFEPRWDCSGKKANNILASDDDLEWQPIHAPADTVFFGIMKTVNGSDTEGQMEFIRRAPQVLRHRGVPTTAADWEDIVRHCDPLDRIAQCAVREELIQFGYPPAWGKGVQVAFRCFGEAASAERLANDLAPEIHRVLEFARPLGLGFEVLRPFLVRGTLRFWTESTKPINKETRQALKEEIWSKVNLNTPRSVGQPLENALPTDWALWDYLRDVFLHIVTARRRMSPKQAIEEFLQHFFKVSRRLILFGPFTCSFEAEQMPSRHDYSVWAIPWIPTPEHIVLGGETI